MARRKKAILPNPLRSRNRWAIRGRNLAHFIMSFLFVIASHLLEWLIGLGRLIAWFVTFLWCLGKKEKKQKKPSRQEIRPAGNSASPEEVFERDDVYEALRSLGCNDKEARWAADSARQELGSSASDEEIVKAALQRLPLFSGQARR